MSDDSAEANVAHETRAVGLDGVVVEASVVHEPEVVGDLAGGGGGAVEVAQDIVGDLAGGGAGGGRGSSGQGESFGGLAPE